MNTMKKRSIMIRVMAVLSVVMMFTICFVGGTFAKYTSSGSNSDSATVAKWSFKVGETDIATSNSFKFDLFDTVKDTGGANETDINPADRSIIAPGTQGSFALVLTNASQVTAQYAIDYTVTNTNNIPVEFSVDGTHWSSELTDVTASDETKLAANSGTTTITVQWRWVFENYTKVADTSGFPHQSTQYYTKNGETYTATDFPLPSFEEETEYYTFDSTRDTSDTALGTAGTLPTLTVAARITVTQVD